MRPIKFRAWEEDGKNMLSPNEVGDHSLNDLEELPYILMQFIGLKDKNGKEIYEGDIVRFCHWSDCDTNKEREWRIGQIVWSDHRFSLHPKQPMDSLYNSKMYEVIGNIYENPELLK